MSDELKGATPETTPQGATPETVVNAAPAVTDAPADGATPSEPTPTTPQDTETPEQLRARLQSAEKRISELNKENEKRRKAAEEAEKTALAEQGKFKELYEKAQAELATANAERERIERERLLDSIAVEFKLPAELRDRLRGDTADELKTDAASLAKLIEKPAVQLPNIGAVNGGSAQPGVLDDARKSELQQRFRLPIA